VKVFVYYNLHRHCWSIRALEGDRRGLVIAHCDRVYLTEVLPRVSEAGRLKARREKRRNVHAGLVGYWNKDRQLSPPKSSLTEITYSPFTCEQFVYIGSGVPWPGSRAVWMDSRRVWSVEKREKKGLNHRTVDECREIDLS
jgi:hypothetical protein